MSGSSGPPGHLCGHLIDAVQSQGQDIRSILRDFVVNLLMLLRVGVKIL